MVDRKHHFLLAGNVLFQNNQSGEMGSVPLNGVLLTDRQDIPARSLAKAQQILQMRFHKNTENSTEITVVDVVIQSITYLGEFSEEEFQEAPVGMTTQDASESILSAMSQANEAANG